MKYTVVIPTCRTDDTINYTLSSLSKQTIKPSEVIIVADIEFKNNKQLVDYKEQVAEYVGKKLKRRVVNNRENKIKVGQHNASYIRNKGLEQVKTDYVLAVDDDNVFNEMFVEDIWHKYQTLKEEEGKELLITPTELHRDSNVVRSQGFTHFNYWLGRMPTTRIQTRQTLAPIRYCSSNCIFGATKLFQDHPFDEQNIPFVYEDFDMTMRMTNAGVPLYVLTQVYTHHMISKKTPLQISYMSTPEDAFQKAKNRILFVRKNAKILDKIKYFSLGLWIHTAALSFKILKYKESRKHVSELLISLRKGTWAGITLDRDESH